MTETTYDALAELRDRISRALAQAIYNRNDPTWPLLEVCQPYADTVMVEVVAPELERLRARIVELTALLNDHDRLMEHALALREFDAMAERDTEVDRLADGGEV